MTAYRNRRAASIENAVLRVTVLREGGHIAEILDKATGVNPLWIPHWASIEPSAYEADRHFYGGGADATLLAGIMGHNVCLDIFGGPSAEEAAAGLPVHGEVSTGRFDVDVGRGELSMRATLASAQLRLTRGIVLEDRRVRIVERVENLSATDRPVGWTQHVTLGPPFLEHGVTEFRASATRSKVFEGTFGPADYLVPGAEFDWPNAPAAAGGTVDLRVYSGAETSSAYTAHLMDDRRDDAFFIAYSPSSQLAFGYRWRRSDFPWLGIWEENRARTAAPWHGRAVTRGMEFGVSPFPETRREMIARGRMFDTPCFRWIPAGRAVEVEYTASIYPATVAPAAADW